VIVLLYYSTIIIILYALTMAGNTAYLYGKNIMTAELTMSQNYVMLRELKRSVCELSVDQSMISRSVAWLLLMLLYR